MKKTAILFIYASGLLGTASGQSLSPQATSSGGGYLTGGGASLSATAGQTFTIRLSAAGSQLSQGFQQPEVDILTRHICRDTLQAGTAVRVPFAAFGVVDGGNVFTAQLSDSAGSFASPVAIGSIAGTAADTTAATIPAGTPTGRGYRIRVASSRPVYNGTDNGANIYVYQPVVNKPDTAAVCAAALPYAWHNMGFNAAGTYGDTVKSSWYDSIYSLVLAVSQPTTSTTPVTVCSSALPYVWNGNGYNAAGTYTVHLTNAAGCDSAAALVLAVKEAGDPLTITPYPYPVSSCGNGADGRMNISRTGGLAPFTYALAKPDGSTAGQPNGYTFNNLAQGTYIATVTDAAGCTATATGITVGAPSAFTVAGYPSPVSACGGADGRVSLSKTGGVWPFTMTLAKPGGSTVTQRNNYVFNNLAAGTYGVTVTDTAGCVATAAGIVVTQAAALAVTPYPYPASSCGNGADGRMNIGRTGGAGPFTFTLAKPDGSTVSQQDEYTFNNLAPGTYGLTVTDAGGCTATATGITVGAPSAFTVAGYPSPVSACGGADGRVSIGKTGGVWPFTMTLAKPGGSTVTQRNNYVFNNLAAGTYGVTVTDTAGCVATAAGIVVTQAAALAVTPYPYPASSCGNGADGRMNIGRTGGAGPFTFTLAKPDGSTVSQQDEYTFNNLAPGTYGLTVTDAGGCTATATGITVGAPSAFTVAGYPSPVSACGGADGRVSIGKTGGVWPFRLTLTGPGGSTATLENQYLFGGLAAGTYSVTVTDTAGCTATAAGITVGTPGNCAATALADRKNVPEQDAAGTLKITALPNPTSTEFRLTVQGGDDRKVVELRVDMYGKTVYHTTGSVFDTYRFGSTFAGGMYIAQVFNGGKTAAIKLIKGN